MAGVPASSRGGSSVLQAATVTLTDAQIKALGTVNDGHGYELVPAPAADQVLWCRGILLTAHTVVAYEFTDEAVPSLHGSYHDVDGFEINAATTTPDANGVVALFARGIGVDDSYAMLEPWALTPDTAAYGAGAASIATAIVGLAGPITGGDPANTLTWHVLYAVASV